jgi:hypothetical protein
MLLIKRRLLLLLLLLNRLPRGNSMRTCDSRQTHALYALGQERICQLSDLEPVG